MLPWNVYSVLLCGGWRLPKSKKKKEETFSIITLVKNLFGFSCCFKLWSDIRTTRWANRCGSIHPPWNHGRYLLIQPGKAPKMERLQEAFSFQDSHLLSIWSDQRLSPSFCSRHLSNTSSTPSALTSAPTEGKRWVMMLGGGLHVCTFKSTTLAVWELLCVCVFIYFFFLEEFVERPVKSCPPGGRPGAGMLTRAAASVNPAHW